MKNIIKLIMLTVASHSYAELAKDTRAFRSAPFLSRGDAGIAFADDEDAIIYNPAALGRGKSLFKTFVVASPTVVGSQTARDLAKQVMVEEKTDIDSFRRYVGKPLHFGAYNYTGIVLRRAAISAMSSARSNFLVSKSPENGGLESLEAQVDTTHAAAFSLADCFGKEFFCIGANLKYVMHGDGYVNVNISEYSKVKELKQDDIINQGRGMGADIGMMMIGAHKAKPSIALTAYDLGDTKIAGSDPTKEVRPIPQIVNLGLAIQPSTATTKFRLALDIEDVFSKINTKFAKKINLGGDVSIYNLLGFGAGIHQGYPAFGLFANLYLVRFDAGVYTQEMGSQAGIRGDTRYFLRLRVGL